MKCAQRSTIESHFLQKKLTVIEQLFDPSLDGVVNFPIPNYKFQSATPIMPCLEGQIYCAETAKVHKSTSTLHDIAFVIPWLVSCVAFVGPQQKKCLLKKTIPSPLRQRFS